MHLPCKEFQHTTDNSAMFSQQYLVKKILQFVDIIVKNIQI